jgi:hypothetical protein
MDTVTASPAPAQAKPPARKSLWGLALDAASAKGATQPTKADNSSGEPTIVDLDTGKVYIVEVKVRLMR